MLDELLRFRQFPQLRLLLWGVLTIAGLVNVQHLVIIGEAVSLWSLPELNLRSSEAPLQFFDAVG